MIELIHMAGGYIVDTDGTQPCNMNAEFFEFDNQTIEEYFSVLGPTTPAIRAEYAVNRKIEAQRRWCGACPARAACLKRAELEQHTGLAGGEFLEDGVVQ